MALSQLRPMAIEGDRPASVAQSGFTKLPDGSLIMRGEPKAALGRPGVLSGLREWAAAKLRPAPAPQDQYWIPPAAPVAPVVAPAPMASAPVPGEPLPAYNAWSDIEEEAAKEQRIKEQLGGISKNILSNERLIQGKWFSNSAPKRVD